MTVPNSAPRNTGSSNSVRRNPRASLTRVWLIRLGVALGAGLLAGATIGVVGVNTLEPGRPQQADSLQIMLDSIAKGQTPAAARDSGGDAGASAAAGDAAATTPQADTTKPASDSTATVPDVVGVEEGAARTALLAAGLTIGGTEFRASTSPAGTVLSTLPVFGASVRRGTSIALVLSDGRAPADTLVSAHLFSPDALSQ